MELIGQAIREVDGGRVRLEGEVLFDDGQRDVVWFETDQAGGGALNRGGDPWVVALAPLAVTLGEPLRVPLPADAQLVEGLRTVSRAWGFWDASLHALELEVPTVSGEGRKADGLVGSLFSGGVDSWYSILRNQREADAGWVPRLNALLLAWGADIPLRRPEAFQALRARLTAVAGHLSCELVVLATNLRDTRWKVTNWPRLAHGCLFISLAHASGRFQRLLIPSSVTYSNGRGWGSHPTTDPLLSSRQTRIVYDTADVNRLGKIGLVCASDLALESLRVCWRSGTDQNCGRCMKCLRTMIALELHGALVRCATFPVQRVDTDQVAHLRCGAPTEYRMLRTLAAESFVAGRPDLGRALQRAYDRSARLDLVGELLAAADQIGLRGTTWLRGWLEHGSIRN